MNEDFGIIERFFALSPPALMMLCISLILRAMKMSPFVRMSKFVRQEDWIFAVVAMAIGGIVYPQIAEIGKVSYNVKFPEMVITMFGVALGGLTVTLHDTVWRFISNRFGIPSGSTEFITKSKTETPTGATVERVVTTKITPPEEPIKNDH